MNKKKKFILFSNDKTEHIYKRSEEKLPT